MQKLYAEINLKNCISVTQDCDKDQENSRMETTVPVKEDDLMNLQKIKL